MPVPSSGTLDYQQINVQLAAGGDSERLFYVANASECGDEPGWYYDVDPATGGTPSHITLCEASCQAFKSGGSLNIELGCDTIVK